MEICVEMTGNGFTQASSADGTLVVGDRRGIERSLTVGEWMR